MKILVTGSNGQLGRSIKDRIHLYPDFQFIFTDIDELDITNFESINQFVAEHNPNIIINCAAYNNVDKAEEEKDKAFILNSEAVSYLAEISKENGIFLIHLSTDFIFDSNNKIALTETDIPNPQSVYAKSKLEGELQVQKFGKDAMIIRTSWLYSEYGHNFVKTILRLAKERREINVVNDQIGTPTYAGDLAVVILKILAQHKSINGVQILHFSNAGIASWYDFAKKIVEIKNLNCIVNPIPTSKFPTAAKRPGYSAMSKEKIKEVFDLEIPKWEDSLRKCLANQ